MQTINFFSKCENFFTWHIFVFFTENVVFKGIFSSLELSHWGSSLFFWNFWKKLLSFCPLDLIRVLMEEKPSYVLTFDGV